MPPPSTLRLGITGFGRLAREYYVPILRRMPNLMVVAVADLLEQSREVARQLLPSARTYHDFHDMCTREVLHAMLVASPPSSHLDAWSAARERGLAAFVEKPLGLISQLSRLPQLSDVQAGLMVNFNRRFWPPYVRIRDAVASGCIGQLRSVNLVLETNVRRWSTVTQHRMSSSEGGVLHDLGSQAIDVVCQTVEDEPLNMLGGSTIQPSGYEHIELQMEFANRVRARCQLSYGVRNRESLVVVGCDRSIILREPNMAPHFTDQQSRLRLHHYIMDYAAFGYRFLAARQRVLHYTMTKALTQFINALRANAQQRPGYAEGVSNLRLLARAAESISCAQVTRG